MYLKAILAIWGLAASPVGAQSFDVVLGKTVLGTLSFSKKASGMVLTTRLNNTPLGVFDGTFLGRSVETGQIERFTGVSASSRKIRKVNVVMANGNVVAKTVEPASEETALSDPKRVARGVVDPVRAVGYLITVQNGCPKSGSIYDGRRTTALVRKDGKVEDGVLFCSMSYKVLTGPGHLSPLKITHADIQLRYDVAGGKQSLSEIQMGSGVFKLRLKRRD